MEIEEKLNIFGYNQEWLDLGILNIEILDAQIKDYEETNHCCFEHYRYGAFTQWVFKTKSATIEEIKAFIKLALSDPDQGMGGAAIIDLLRATWLTDDQFKYISSISVLKEKFSKELDMTFIKREISKNYLLNEVFEKAMLLKNSSIERRLLEHKGISEEQVETLSKEGTGKKVRNIAAQLLRGK